MTFTQEQINSFQQYALGSCKAGWEIANALGVDDDDVLDLAVAAEMSVCGGCGWWVEDSALTEDGEACEDCRE